MGGRHVRHLKTLGAWCGLLVLTAGLLEPATGTAQSPDLREIQPFLAIIVDSSGSMERLPGCICTTRSCSECLPDCSLSNDALGKPPAEKKNRWALTLEALTGTFDQFECRGLDRASNNGATYDLNYYLPYHQPWSCTSADYAGGASCRAFPSSGSSHAIIDQAADGILDNYSGRVRFGLMTFDGWGTYQGAPPLVAHGQFDVTRSAATGGLWSYGSYDSAGNAIYRTDGSQPGRFHYPNCGTDYMIDTGVRGPQAGGEGGLVSLNSCTSPPCDAVAINGQIQQTLLDTRPYGGTPIAAALDDLYHHIQSDIGADVFGSCRNRYGLLITDGYPDDDFRAFGCDCTQNSDPTAPGYCGGAGNNPADMFCPYPRPEEVAYDLVTGRSGVGIQDNPPLQQLFVIGLSVVDPDVKARLNLIAEQGNSDQLPDGSYALFADDNDPLTDDLQTLRSQLDAVVSKTISPVSRSVPTFVRGTDAAQYQISTGFDVSARAGQPWMGFIERKRYTCQNGEVQEETLSGSDEFHNELKGQNDRALLSVATDLGLMDGPISSHDGAATCSGECPLQPLGDSAFTPEHFGLLSGNTAERTAIVNWMYGVDGSPRASWPLGDIYHSSPVVLAAPSSDQGDEAYGLFRMRSEIHDRPLTLFINSNDGILHAFSVEDWSDTDGSKASLREGQEIWGFVPPLLVNDLRSNLSQHQLMMDGTPIIKDVYFDRDVSAVAEGNEYRTVLITGMRGGGKAYVALDVTDVHRPTFLWQFTDADMGFSYGQAAITQARYQLASAAGSPTKHGAVAILPGGSGALGVSNTCNTASSPIMNPSYRDAGNQVATSQVAVGDYNSLHTHRSDVRCWQEEGRSLYFIDVETGLLIKKLDASVFPSPLVGSPVVFSDDVGTRGRRAFVMDADGVLWRIDMSEVEVRPDEPLRGWTARPFHDLFYDRGFDQGQPAFERPIITTDPSGRAVVLVATGNTDNFEDTSARNRVVSLTEDFEGSGTVAAEADRYSAVINWEIREQNTNHDGFEPSELVTGSMALNDGQLFFASYIAVPPEDPCDMGLGRYWSVHYRDADRSQPTGANPATYGPIRIAESGFNVTRDEATPNLLVQGLALTQRPSCTQETTIGDTIFGQYQTITPSTPPATMLVAQAAGDEAQRLAGSALGSVEMQVQTKRTPPVLTSFAGSVE